MSQSPQSPSPPLSPVFSPRHRERGGEREREDRERGNANGANSEPKHPPSKTLYITEVPTDLPFPELEAPFLKLRGFVEIRRKPNFIFAEFSTIQGATDALKALQGFQYRTATKPINLDYDKSADRKRKAFDENREFPPRNPDWDRSRDRGERVYYDRERMDRDRDRFERIPRHHGGPPPSSSSSSRDFYDRERMERDRELFGGSNGGPRDYRMTGMMDDPRSRERFDYLRNSSEQILLQQSLLRGIPWSAPPSFPPAPPKLTSSNPISDFTLYVTSLPDDVTERELSILFRFLPGFLGIRLVRREGRPPIAFADFVDLQSANVGLNSLQGYKLDRESFGLSLEFDKSAHGRERDRYESRDRFRDRRSPPPRDRDRDDRRR